MYFYKSYGLKISSEIKLPELSVDEPAEKLDLIIKSGKVNLPKLNKTSIYRRGIRALFGQKEDGNLFLHWDGVASYEARNGNELVTEALTDDNNLLSLFTVSEALGLILFQRGYFLLHASSVQVGDEAWCFMGSPGAGKSTTAAAFIKAGCKLLSDDLTAIQFDGDDNAFILPAYPQLKIWDKTVNGLEYDKSELSPVSEGVNKFSYQPKGFFSHEPVPLRKILFMHKAKNRAAMKQLGGGEIPVEMLKNFPLPIQLLVDASLQQHFLQSFRCAQSAGIFKKRRPEGFDNLAKWVRECILPATLKTEDQ
jgi:hypothetical protein